MNLKYTIRIVSGMLLLGSITTLAYSTTSGPSRRSFLGSAITTASAVGVVLIGDTTISSTASSNHPLTIIASAVDTDTDNAADPYADFITSESGLRYKVIKEGIAGGEPPVIGAMVNAHYTGWLDGFDSDKKFDSSRDRNRPFRFAVGKGQVIRGWDESFSSMIVGEKRQIIIPPRLGYGDRGAGGIIPGGATLYFDVELLSIG
jgi:peptidylprolyl isomerase